MATSGGKSSVYDPDFAENGSVCLNDVIPATSGRTAFLAEEPSQKTIRLEGRLFSDFETSCVAGDNPSPPPSPISGTHRSKPISDDFPGSLEPFASFDCHASSDKNKPVVINEQFWSDAGNPQRLRVL